MFKKRKTQSSIWFRVCAEFFIKIFCRGNFRVDGKENIVKAKERRESGNFIIVSSHFCDLDGPAAVKAFGKEFNLHIAVESMLYRSILRLIILLIAGIKNFSPLSYRRVEKHKKESIFSLENFEQLTKKIEKGKTIWIVSHQMSLNREMNRARIGPIYLAQKTNSQIIPVAPEAYGPLITMENNAERIQALFSGMKIDYHIGEAITLEPIDVSIIDDIFAKKQKREEITPEDRKTLNSIHKRLKHQADAVSKIISNMLPEEQRGFYK